MIENRLTLYMFFIVNCSMTDEEKYQLTEYDIQCLMHVYNKFTEEPPLTDPRIMLNYFNGTILTEITQYDNHHTRIISSQLATLFGDPTNLIMKQHEIEEKFKVYIIANCEHSDADGRWYWSFIPNQPLCDIMKIPNTGERVLGVQFINQIDNEHIQLYVQPEGYVLK